MTPSGYCDTGQDCPNWLLPRPCLNCGQTQYRESWLFCLDKIRSVMLPNSSSVERPFRFAGPAPKDWCCDAALGLALTRAPATTGAWWEGRLEMNPVRYPSQVPDGFEQQKPRLHLPSQRCTLYLSSKLLIKCLRVWEGILRLVIRK